MITNPDLYTLTLTCRPDQIETVEALFEESALALSILSPPRSAAAQVEVLLDGEPAPAWVEDRLGGMDDAPSYTIAPVGNLDWIKKVAQDFPPLPIARWTVYGAAHRDKITDFKTALQIDATSAFGTGEHPTTRGCLEALDRLLKNEALPNQETPSPCGRVEVFESESEQKLRGGVITDATNNPSPKILSPAGSKFSTLPQGEGDFLPSMNILSATNPSSGSSPHHYSMLDMGCGSGILAMAFAKAVDGGVGFGVDMDELSVTIANENAAINGVADRTTFIVGMGYAPPLVEQGAPYDLIMANIFADPLCAMAGDLKNHLKVGGHAILSGLLNTQAETVIAAHLAQGLTLTDHQKLGEWSVLALTRSM